MGIRLKRTTEPTWVDIGRDAAVLALAPSTAIVFAARASSSAMFAELMGAGKVVSKAGGRIEGIPDLSNPERAKAQQDALFVVALAELVITDWKNIRSDEGTDLDFDAGLLCVLFEDHRAADQFLSNYLHPLNQVASEGNG